MKILWLSHLIPYPPKGGVLQRSYNLIKEISKHHEVHLLAFNQKDLMRMFYKTNEEGIRESKNHLEDFCASTKFVEIPCDKSSFHKKLLAFKSLFTTQPYTLNWLTSEEYRNEIMKYIKTYDFDFVNFDTISLAPFKEACGNIPSSLDHHNIESHMLLRRADKENNWFKKIYFSQEERRLEKFEKYYCPQFRFNFTCSEIDSERLKSISPDSSIYTVPNGVDINYFTPEPEEEKEDRILFVGTLSWYPNIEAVLFIANNIWPKVKREFPNLIVDIIGANPPQEIVRLSQTDPNFRVHGFVDDVRPFFRKSKCYVCPIKDGGGTKLKILDALSMGMAIIADEIACEGINVENGKNVVLASSGDEYLSAIRSILTDQTKREELENNAIKLARTTYSYERIGEKLSNLFNDFKIKQ